MEEALKVTDHKSPNHEDLRFVQENLKWRLNIMPRRTDCLFQFTTDRKSFRYCIPNAMLNGTDEKAPLDSYVFQKRALSEENLIQHFSKTTIGTWIAREEGSLFKLWSGIHNGHGLGIVSPNPEPITPARFPPIGAVRSEWSTAGAPHVFDKLIAHPISEYKLYGKDDTFGEGLIKLEHTSSQPGPLAFGAGNTGAKKCEKLSYTTFWIDRSHGCLPVRVEQGFRYVVDGVVLNEGHNSPDSVTIIEKIKTIGASYYPFEVKTENFITYSKDSIRPPSPADFVRGATFDFPRAVVNREYWHTKSLEHGGLGEPIEYGFNFPQETRYFDKGLQRAMIVGLTAEELDAKTQAEFPPIPPK
ncbi:hypothetical protein [Planctomicrobium sp. SH527]|uniref:hypothetical protein n=1 Tax=Planctomicrobium sp. SH527 TaxID=3448123 RepID=UPI003F5BBE3C